MKYRFWIEMIKKEMLEIKSDWKGLVISLFISFMFFPVTTFSIIPTIKQSTSFNIYVDNKYNNNEFLDLLKESKYFKFTNYEDANIKLLIEKNNTGILNYIVEYNSSNQESNQGMLILKEIFNEYSNNIYRKNLDKMNIDFKQVNNLNIELKDESTYDIGRVLILQLFPIGLSLAIIMGGMSQGMDAIAGERERGTMESLLLLPIKNYQLVIMKYISVLIVNILNIFVAFASLYISTRILYYNLNLEGVLISSQDYIYLFRVSLLGSSIFSAIYVLLSCLSKNLKQSQTYCSIINFIFLISTMLIVNIEDKIKGLLHYIPGINISILIEKIFSGIDESLKHNMINIELVSIIFIILIIYLSSKLVKKEKYIC